MTGILVSDFLGGIMIYIRILAMFMVVPLFNNKNIPMVPKLALSLLITYIILFSVDTSNINYDDRLIPLAFIAFKEGITGMLMGLVLRFVFEGIGYAGLNIGRDMGIVMTEMFDPSTESQNNMLTILMIMMATVVFLLIKGHYFIIQALIYSFKVIPLGFYPVNESVHTLMIKYATIMFILSIQIAAPVIVAFFLIHLASGILSRVSPNFQVFFVILPLKIVVGIAIFIVLIPMYVYLFQTLLKNYELKLLEIIKYMAG